MGKRRDALQARIEALEVELGSAQSALELALGERNSAINLAGAASGVVVAAVKLTRGGIALGDYPETVGDYFTLAKALETVGDAVAPASAASTTVEFQRHAALWRLSESVAKAFKFRAPTTVESVEGLIVAVDAMADTLGDARRTAALAKIGYTAMRLELDQLRAKWISVGDVVETVHRCLSGDNDDPVSYDITDALGVSHG